MIVSLGFVFVGDVLRIVHIMVNHHLSPPFGRIGFFFFQASNKQIQVLGFFGPHLSKN